MPRPPRSRRALRSAPLLAAAVLAVGCADPAQRDDTSRTLADGRRLADSLRTSVEGRTADSVAVVALGYLEQARLGAGSVFRLAEAATVDPRLGAPVGRRLAWALLDVARREESHAIAADALAGDPYGPASLGRPPLADGARHAHLIDSTVAAAPSARTGEATVRLAYLLARAERLVGERQAAAAVHAAALARDRRLVGEDVAALLRDAAARPDSDALALLAARRSARRVRSEAPLLADALRPDERRAAADAERLLATMRAESARVMALALAPAEPPVAPDSTATVGGDTLPAARTRSGAAGRSAASAGVASADTTGTSTTSTGAMGTSATSVGAASVGAATVGAPSAVEVGRPAARIAASDVGTTPSAGGWLTPTAAGRLAARPEVRAGVPAAPLVVTLGGFRRPTPAAPTDGLDSASARVRALRDRLAARVRTPEALAAEWTLLRAELPAEDPARRDLAALVAAAVVALRADAQAPVDGGRGGAAAPGSAPARSAGEALAAVEQVRLTRAASFVSPDWRDAVGWRVLDGVADLRRVLPLVSFDGLLARVGESPRGDRVLALHDPASRTVWLPPLTVAGTVAHELGHDLDWQAARARLAVRGTYATDRSVRNGRGGPIAAAVRALADAAPRSVGRSRTDAAHAPERPAERFARGFDFLVAAALAREGRANGFLSAVQDEVLVGYAGVVAPEPGDGSAEALLSLTSTLTPVPPVTGGWFLARWGAGAPPSALAAARGVLGALPDWSTERALRGVGVPVGLTGDAPPPDGGRWRRRLPEPSACAAEPDWVDRVRWLAADARARGVLHERAPRAAAIGWGSWSWAARAALGTGPWEPSLAEPAVARIRDALLRADAATRRGRPDGVRMAVVPGCG